MSFSAVAVELVSQDTAPSRVSTGGGGDQLLPRWVPGTLLGFLAGIATFIITTETVAPFNKDIRYGVLDLASSILGCTAVGATLGKFINKPD